MNYVSYKSDIWNKCLCLFKESIQIALQFISRGCCETYREMEPTKTEVAVNSRYLHRGYYCPSPVFDLILANSRRGKILGRPTKRSKITHRYFFDKEDDIYLTEYFVDDSKTGYEYIMRQGNKRFGFVFGTEGVLGGIGVEIYSGNKLQSYMWAKCYNASSTDNNWQTDYVRYEVYEYEDSELAVCHWHLVALLEDEYNEPQDALELVNYERYEFSCRDGKLAFKTV